MEDVKKSHNEQDLERVADTSKTLDHIVDATEKVSLTEQWKRGELPKSNYWIKYISGKIDIWWLSEGVPIETRPEISEVLAPVPSYEEWQAQKECLLGMMEANKILSRRYNNIKVNGNYPDRISKLKSRIRGLTEELEPFTDPYFRGLTTKHIAELAKKSIRLTKQSCDDNTTIQRLKELLCYCADILEELDDKDRDIEILLEEVNEVLA